MIFLFIKQDVSVIEQEKIDKLMLDMDGTDNKCKLHCQINVDCENGKVQIFYRDGNVYMLYS